MIIKCGPLDLCRATDIRYMNLLNRLLNQQLFDCIGNPYDSAGFSRATIQVCKEEGVPVLVAIGALDAGQVKEWKDAGFKVIYRDMYPTVASARASEAAGVDILVATGCDEGDGMPVEATGTIVKTALMVDAVSIPVLSAGGIVNEALAKASACVGAEGAYAGTRFVMSKECRAAQATKEDILNTGAET